MEVIPANVVSDEYPQIVLVKVLCSQKHPHTETTHKLLKPI
jgi:hypothetical protein